MSDWKDFDKLLDINKNNQDQSIRQAVKNAAAVSVEKRAQRSRDMRQAVKNAANNYLTKKYTPMAQEMLKNGASAAEARAALRYTVLPEERERIAEQNAAAAKPTREQKYAQKNEDNLKAGKPLEINDGRIYTFSQLTPEQYRASIDYADSEIERLKSEGGSSGVVGYIKEGAAYLTDKAFDVADRIEDIPGLGDVFGAVRDSEFVSGIEDKITDYIYDNADNSERIRELENYRNTVQKYYDSSIEYTLIEKLNKDAAAKTAFEGYFNSDILIQSSLADISYYADKENSEALLDEAKSKYSSAVSARSKYRKQLEALGYSEADIETYSKIQNKEIMEPILEYVVEKADEHPIITTGINIALSPLRGTTMLADQLFNVAGVHGLNAGALLEDASQLTQATVIEKIENEADTAFGAGVGKVFYSAAVSGLESMLMNRMFGKGAEVLLGLNAGMSTYKSAIERGLTDEQAITTGFAAGIFEAVFEHIPLDKLRAFQSSPSTTLLPLIKNALKQSVVEGFGEGLTDIANEMCDVLVNGGLSNYAQALNSGMTTSEYALQFGAQLIETFATGALSGGGMVALSGAAGYAHNKRINAAKDTAEGEEITRFEGLTENVLSDADNGGVILRQKANSLRKKSPSLEALTDKELTRYYKDLGELNRKTIRKQRESDIDSILSSEEFKSLKRSERNAIRSSVLTQMNNPDIVSKEQRDVLETDNAKSVLSKMQELEVRHMEEGDSKRLDDIGKKAEDAPRTSSDVRKAILKEEAEKLVKNTFEARNADGYTVEAGAVRSITDGEFEVVQDSSGATAKLSELKIADSEAGKLYSELQGAALSEQLPLSVPAVNVALSMYNEVDNTSARAYALWAHDAYKAGKLGLLFSEFEGLYNKDGEIRYLGDITRDQLQVMYELGARDIETKPGVTRIGHKGLSKLQAEQVFIIDKLAKKYGLEVVLVDNRLTDGDGRGVNGFYQSGTNRIVLSLQTEMNLLMVVAGHEMFHFLKNQNAAYGKHLQNVVISFLKSDAKYDYDKIYAEMSAQYEGLSEDDILEEITAQYLGVALSDETVLQKIVNEADTKERSFLQKLLSHLKEFISDIKSLLKSYASEDATVRAAMESPVEVLQEIARQFDAALEQVAKEKKPAVSDGGVKASVKKTETIPTVEHIASVRNIGRKSVNAFTSEELEKTQYWAKMFWEQLNVKSPFFRAWFGDWRAHEKNKVSVSNIQLLPFAERTEAEKYIKNGMKDKTLFRGEVINVDTDFTINVGAQVYNDTLTYANRKYTRDNDINSYLVRLSILNQIDLIVKETIHFDSVIASSDKNDYRSFMHKFYNVANINGDYYLVKLTVDELNSSDKPIRRAYNVNNIKITPIAVSQVYKPAGTMDVKGETISNISISKLFDIVKKYDNEFNPNPVNPAFLNDDGTPKVYYHGTNATWTEYDLSKNVNQMWGEGIYLTPDYNRAKLYGDNVMPFYVRALVDNRTAKKTGQKRDHTIMKNGDVLVYSPEQIKSATDNIGTFDRTKKDIRYSYAGVKAKTADIKTLDYAARLEDVGKASPEEIRQQTGWFRGYDNKWRFEISDRDMQIDTRGLFSMNPDVRRYTQLVDKAYFDMTATEEELQELVSLEKNLDGVSVEPKTLGELIQHPALFEAYPQLKDVNVYFDDIEARGAYNPVFNAIYLQKKLKLDKNQLTKTLVHEIQHAVQHIEGFASGASASYWADFYKEDYEDLKNMRENLKLWLNDIKYFDYVKASMQEVTSKKKTLEQHWKDIESFKKNSKYAREIENCEKTISELEEKLPSPDALYERTAGEIEARDAAMRHWRTDEARKEKRPDIDRTDVVFAEENAVGYSIVEPFFDEKGVEYKNAVLLDTDFFDGISPKNWGWKLKKYVEDRSKNNPFILPVVDEKGNVQQLQFAGIKDRVSKTGHSNHKVIDKLWNNSDNAAKLAVLHIDEIISISEEKNPYYTKENNHQWLDENGWLHRTANVINARSGDIYELTIDIAKARGGRTILYATSGKTKKVGNVQVSSLMLRGSGQNSNLEDNVTYDVINVKKDFSRQRINESWEDIRTKMYESEVHEDIINEIEDYITRLRKRKISRETAITEGLIPKYEAILKVAREYTKGSEVSARELADVINELMWAAHDGNLDTKQFIATVKLIAEDIIRTGSEVNDDKYREYEEFRKMTREETVYVSQQVYNQYVEEYSTRKNLNRACAGKIKIRPYDNNNRTGRALDDFYAELTERFPELLREDVDVYHQLYEILNAWQMIQPWTEYRTDKLGIKSRADLEQAALMKAEEILSEVLGITDTVKTIADKYSDKLKYQQEHYKEYYRKQAEEGRRRRRESEEMSVLKKRILRNTNHLADMIRNETDQRHIPEAFKEPVMEFLNMVRLVNATGREVLYTGGTLNMVKLERAYMEYYNPKTEGGETAPKYQYDEDVVEWIKDLETAFGENADIKKMSLENLEKVDKIVSHFSHIIKHENDIFINGRREKFVSLANASIKEMYNHVRKPEYKAQKKLLDVEHGMLTPIYFFKLIGTTTENGHVNKEVLYNMFKDLQDGQDKWYRNIERVQSDLADIKKQHHYSEAWKRDTTEFSLDSGEKIKLTPEEIMYMRALYIRETKHINNLSHLTEGGVIVENDGKLKSYAEKKAAVNETREARKQFDGKKSFSQADIVEGLKKNLTTEDLSKIFASLTDDMLGYSDAVVRMLSTTGAELGNKVSMELFGIRKFTEQNYVPISVASNFIATTMEKRAADTAKLKNRSFTKRTTRDANAAIYVRGLTDIAVEHMQEMSLYNAMTIPIENLTRIFNYQLPTTDVYDKEGNRIKITGNSFKEIFEAIYGERGLKYLQDFLKDLNGGNQTTARDFTAGMMSRFKKSAVYGSLSVAIQQPSAVVRACAFVDAKYFVPKPYSTKDYEEMLRYNPVAGIKEIGRFDTGLGQTATEWILDEKGGALKKVDDMLSFLPGMMDRMTWVYIWNAVKRKTAHNTGLKGEALLTKAAERFRDVIDYTQVYDSTLSRSAMMRDKGSLAKMATAFMAEPTLSYNMLRDAAINAKKDPRQTLRSVAAFVGATLLNAMLKSLITALRKDDEETNYFEIYISDIFSNFVGDLNPLGMIPIVKDVMSIIEGYDVKRLDMSLFESLVNSAKVITNKISKGKIPTFEECMSLVGTATAFTGVPLNNVFRDFMAVISTIQGIGKSPDFSLREVLTSEKTSDAVKLYRAIIAEDEDAIYRYRTVDDEEIKKYMSQGYSEADAILKATDNAENNFHNKVIEGLIAEDIRIQEAAEALQGFEYEEYEELIDELTALGFDKNDVIKAIDKYISSTEEKTYTPTGGGNAQMYEYEDLHKAVEAQDLKAVKHVVKRLKEAGREDKNIMSSLTDKFKEVYISYCASGNDNGMQRLKDLLLACDVGYSDKTFSDWEKEYLKNKKK